MPNMKRSLLCALSASLLFVSCGPHNDEQNIVWRGDLVEVDGAAVSPGIMLEIQKVDPKEGRGRFLYRLDTGCSGVGFVDVEGAVSALEVLRPCSASAVEAMQRLNVLMSDTQMQGSPKAVLQWNEHEASLAASDGRARFRNSQAPERSANVR